MAKKKEYRLATMTDIKIFLLFLLDNIGYPIDHSALIGIVADNTNEIITNYDECLIELVDKEHLLYDEVDGEKYYMISESGRSVARELYDFIDKDLREKSIKVAIRYMSLTQRGVSVRSSITETESKRFAVNMKISDADGEIMNTTVTVNARSEAERIRENFESRPYSTYRAFLLSLTARPEYLS
jgi:hypothetical protein